MDLAAALVGALLGLLAGPVADRVATNAALRAPLLRDAPRSPRLPLVAGATALLGAACGLVYGFTLEAATSAFFLWVLVVVTRTDLERRIIPNRVVVPATLVVLVLRTLDQPSVEWLLACVLSGAALFLVVLVYPRGLGMGDAKLAAFLGAGLGISVVVALFVGFLLGALPALVLLVRHGTGARKLTFPLGPWLALGGLVALFWGDAVIDWYRDLSV